MSTDVSLALYGRHVGVSVSRESEIASRRSAAAITAARMDALRGKMFTISAELIHSVHERCCADVRRILHIVEVGTRADLMRWNAAQINILQTISEIRSANVRNYYYYYYPRISYFSIKCIHANCIFKRQTDCVKSS